VILLTNKHKEVNRTSLVEEKGLKVAHIGSR